MVEMEPEVALRLFEDGATIIFLDLPVTTEIGIDFQSWNTAEKFKGIKMIPPGVHYIYYSAVSKERQTAPRTGFFHYFHKKEVLVRRWHADEEDLIDSVGAEEKERLASNLKELDGNLGAYPYDSWKRWVSLSDKLTESIIARLEPKSKKISSVVELVPEQFHSEAKKKRRTLRGELEDSMLPAMQPRPGTELNFTSIPDRYPANASASEVTRYSLDSSYVLQQLLIKWETPRQLLGEIQMAFLCFIVGQVYTAFEQWKKLLHIACTADEMLVKEPQFFLDLIGDLYFQMQEVPSDFFVDIVSQDNFLTQTLRLFFSNVLDNQLTDKRLEKRCVQLQRYLTQRFEWDFDAEAEEDAPVIVELPDV